MLDKRCIRPLHCPICNEALAKIEKSLQCANKHTFDVAREGYVNLLVSNKKLSTTVGDSGEMLKARQAFFDEGYYQPLAKTLKQISYQLLSDIAEPVILDAGCGEGYYLEQVANHLATPQGCFFGIDVAKKAIQMAAKRKGYGRYLVADINKKIPLTDESTHLIFNVFAPRNFIEFSRILRADGSLIIVIPNEKHLASLRERFNLLTIQSEKEKVLRHQMRTNFLLENKQTIQFNLQLNEAALHNLILMTPSARHLSEQSWQEIKKQASFNTEAYFEMLQFKKKL